MCLLLMDFNLLNKVGKGPMSNLVLKYDNRENLI